MEDAKVNEVQNSKLSVDISDGTMLVDEIKTPPNRQEVKPCKPEPSEVSEAKKHVCSNRR